VTIVEHIELCASDHDAFVAAFAPVRAALLATRGCRSVDVTRNGDVYRARIEWRSIADRDAVDVTKLEQPLAGFERRAHSIDTLLDLGGDVVTHDAAELRRAFGLFPSGIAVIAAQGPRGPAAMLVSSFTSVSLKPTLVSFCAAHTSTTWPLILDARSCCVNLLAASQANVVKQLSSKSEDRFQNVAWRPASSGAPILEGVVGWMDCTIAEVRIAGDHDVVLLHVRAYATDATLEPLVFHRSGYRVLAP
jgi:3-hydroxy-9,10-secoandrosta-1,3,5(10)-triene-9,17-dione monooxygenase reductase component